MSVETNTFSSLTRKPIFRVNISFTDHKELFWFMSVPTDASNEWRVTTVTSGREREKRVGT